MLEMCVDGVLSAGDCVSEVLSAGGVCWWSTECWSCVVWGIECR
jgi:hypothetical protein